MRPKRKATVLAGLAIFVLLGGCLVALVVPRFQVAIVGAAFIGYVACARRAMALWRADDFVFVPKRSDRRGPSASPAVEAGLAVGTIAAFSLGRTAARARSLSASRREREGRHPAHILETILFPKSR